MEHCIRRDGAEYRKFLHRSERTIDKGSPDNIDNMSGVSGPQQAVEQAAEARQRRQRYMD